GLLALEELLHHRIVLLDDGLDQLGARRSGGIRQLGRDVLIFELRAQRLVEPDDRAVVDQIDEALEAALDPDREIEDERTRPETILDHLDATLEIRTGAVELVDEAHARHAIL